jgi:hypothetical protein
MRSLISATALCAVLSACAAAPTTNDSSDALPPVFPGGGTSNDGGASGSTDAGPCATTGASGPGLAVTDRGAVRGALEGGAWAWKGIPYAAPPVGGLRWQPPSDVACNEGIRDVASARAVPRSIARRMR